MGQYSCMTQASIFRNCLSQYVIQFVGLEEAAEGYAWKWLEQKHADPLLPEEGKFVSHMCNKQKPDLIFPDPKEGTFFTIEMR